MLKLTKEQQGIVHTRTCNTCGGVVNIRKAHARRTNHVSFSATCSSCSLWYDLSCTAKELKTEKKAALVSRLKEGKKRKATG